MQSVSQFKFKLFAEIGAKSKCVQLDAHFDQVLFGMGCTALSLSLSLLFKSLNCSLIYKQAWARKRGREKQLEAEEVGCVLF